jgi:hypothetical protein
VGARARATGGGSLGKSSDRRMRRTTAGSRIREMMRKRPAAPGAQKGVDVKNAFEQVRPGNTPRCGLHAAAPVTLIVDSFAAAECAQEHVRFRRAGTWGTTCGRQREADERTPKYLTRGWRSTSALVERRRRAPRPDRPSRTDEPHRIFAEYGRQKDRAFSLNRRVGSAIRQKCSPPHSKALIGNPLHPGRRFARPTYPFRGRSKKAGSAMLPTSETAVSCGSRSSWAPRLPCRSLGAPL